MRRRDVCLLFALAAAAPLSGQTAVEIPGGSVGIGFDDLRFAFSLGRILAPAGRAGVLALVDPASRNVTTVPGFSARSTFGGGHDDGVTSADEAGGRIVATDRTALRLAVVDPRSLKIVSSAKLAGPPDYVRYVEATGEVWVTQPDRERIEIFKLPAGDSAPAHEAFLSIPGGPESLVVDARKGRAYTHLWNGRTVAIDVRQRSVAATWDNGCRGSRGIAFDEARGWVFAGCAEGKAVVIDATSGRNLSSLSAGNGVDVIDYNPRLRHLYLPGARSATMAVLGVSGSGALTLLATLPTASGAHCVAADASGNVFVCDPGKGRLLAFHDSYPVSR
jgi:DNA-binding beta-propeller fold protein YncE